MRTLAATIFTIAFLASIHGGAEESIRLSVKASADPTHAFPGSKLYVASILNMSDAKLALEAVRMPGGVCRLRQFLSLFC